MQIDMEQINCFLTVARHLNFTKAADVLYMSQPAVSRKVSALEAQLNIPLFQRGKRDITLTTAGEEFRDLFTEYHARLYALQKKHTLVSAQRVAFGIFHGCNLMDGMGNFIDAFQAKYEGLDLWGTSADSTSLLDGLHTGKFDFAIGLREPFVRDEELVVEDIGQVRRMVVYAKENPLASKQNLTLNDFADQPYYAFIDEKTSMELRTNKRIFAHYGFTPKLKLLKNMDSIIMALHRGQGYIILDERQRIVDNTTFAHFLLPDTQMLSLAYLHTLKKDAVQAEFISCLLPRLRDTLSR